MKLYAISDLHLANVANQQALIELPSYPEDWLIIAGDIGETEAQLTFALTVLTRRFARVIWVPGNHDLWTVGADPDAPRGEAKYQRLVALCRAHGVLTPEDPYIRWPGPGAACLIVPLFLLYDYSFRPDEIPFEQAVNWAAETEVICSDEYLLHPDPFSSRAAWCAARCALTEQRLGALDPTVPLVLINHFPLRRDLVRLFRIPRFSIWCGTRRTENWHVRFPVEVVVSGHLHMRAPDYRAGVRFEEVSLGYPRDWRHERGIRGYLREILPGPSETPPEEAGPIWHR